MEQNGVKSARLLEIYSRLSEGAVLKKSELAQDFHVTQRSIQRDIEDLRCFFAERHLEQDVIYDTKLRGYLRGAEYHYSWTASRTVETLLTDVRAFYLHGRRMREREKQRAFWTSTHALCVDVQRRRGPAGTRSPAAGSCAVLVSFTVCHRCVEIQERAFTRLAVRTVLPAHDAAPLCCPAL